MRTGQVISQKEARGYRAEAKRYKQAFWRMRRHWTNSWPEGLVFLGRLKVPPEKVAVVETAKRLAHAVIVAVDDGALTLWGDPISVDKEQA